MAGLLMLGAGSASAATLTVTTTTDETASGDHQCSLREAIATVEAPGTSTDCGTAANAGNTIVLGPTTYALSIHPSGPDDNSTGDLDVQGVAGLTIEGAGMGATVISGAGLKDRLLRVTTGSITLQNLTLSDGRTPDGADGVGTAISGVAPTAGQPGSDGGAISNAGTLNLDHVALTNNSAGNGGTGGASSSGQPSFGGAGGGNGGRGGGIYNAPAGVLNLTDVTMSGNRSGNGGRGGAAADTAHGGGGGGCCGDGGGLFNDGGSVEAAASTFSQNIAGDGGAGGFGGSPFSGTGGTGGTGQGGSSGGAIASAGGSLKITNSTISGNLSGSGGDGGSGGIGGTSSPNGAGGNAGNGSAGGGIFASAGANVTLTNVTIAQNESGGPGAPGPGQSNGSPGSAAQAAGVFVNGATVTADNTLLAFNSVGNCGGPSAVADDRNNLSFAGSGCPSGFLNGDPRLGALQDNGGPTQTMDLQAGSAAIDAGGGCLSSDQRGAARPSGPACDIGAYEVAPPTASTGAATSVTGSGATLNGSATPNQSSASVRFEYGTTVSYGATTGAQQLSGFSPSPFSMPISGLAPSTTYHYRVIVTSPDGSATGTDATFTTGVASPPTHAAAPNIGRLVMKPSAFRTRRRKGHRRDKTGTTLSYTDSQPARTAFTVWRCTKFKKRRCRRYSRVGTFSRADTSGRNVVRWNGKLGGRALKPGRYRLDAQARTGSLAGNAISVLFTILR